MLSTRHSLIVCVLVLLASAMGAAGQRDLQNLEQETPQSVFQVNGVRPTTIVVGFTETLPDIDTSWPSMLLQLQGAVEVLDSRSVGRLLATPMPRQPATTWTEETQRLWVLHMQSARSEMWKRVEIGRDLKGVLLARDIDGPRDRPMAIELDRERFAEFAWNWSLCNVNPAESEDVQGGSPRAPRPGEVVTLSQPLFPSWIHLNEDTLKERLGGGRVVVTESAAVDLSNEELLLRLPVGYTPDKPAGLIVWIDAVDYGPPRNELFNAADAHNLICVSAANSGNNRPYADRCQLTLDAVQNVCMRFAVDRERIYTAGISGGARIATIVTQCFPDIFDGSVADVALSTYMASSAGNGLYWRADIGRPSRQLLAMLKGHRIAGVTGPRDGNYESMKARERDMKKDGLDVRVFEYDMGHEMCTAGQFLTALEWVEEPLREERAKATEEATKAMESYEQMVQRQRFDQAIANRQLMKVVEIAPWTEVAWKACEILLEQHLAR